MTGEPVPTYNPDHQPIVPTAAGVPPYCTCGYVGGNGTNRPLLADHLRQIDPGYGRRTVIQEEPDPLDGIIKASAGMYEYPDEDPNHVDQEGTL